MDEKDLKNALSSTNPPTTHIIPQAQASSGLARVQGTPWIAHGIWLHFESGGTLSVLTDAYINPCAACYQYLTVLYKSFHSGLNPTISSIFFILE